MSNGKIVHKTISFIDGIQMFLKNFLKMRLLRTGHASYLTRGICVKRKAHADGVTESAQPVLERPQRERRPDARYSGVSTF